MHTQLSRPAALPALVPLLMMVTNAWAQSGGADMGAVENQYLAAVQIYVETPYREKVAELDRKYLGALEKALQSATQGARLEEALALRDEVARVKEDRLMPGSDTGVDPALAKLRAAYREQLEKLRVARRQAGEPIVKKFEAALVELQEKLTRDGNLKEAEAILAWRKAGLAVRLLGADAVTAPVPAASGNAAGTGEGRPREVPPEAVLFMGRWFMLLEGRMGWDTARRKCESMGGRLVVVPDQSTWAFLTTIIGERIVWLGASDAETEGLWKWVDGTPLRFSAWTPGQPNNQDNEDYVHTWKGGWNDNQRDGRWGDNYVGGCVCEWVKAAGKSVAP